MLGAGAGHGGHGLPQLRHPCCRRWLWPCSPLLLLQLHALLRLPQLQPLLLHLPQLLLQEGHCDAAASCRAPAGRRRSRRRRRQQGRWHLDCQLVLKLLAAVATARPRCQRVGDDAPRPS